MELFCFVFDLMLLFLLLLCLVCVQSRTLPRLLSRAHTTQAANEQHIQLALKHDTVYVTNPKKDTRHYAPSICVWLCMFYAVP